MVSGFVDQVVWGSLAAMVDRVGYSTMSFDHLRSIVGTLGGVSNRAEPSIDWIDRCG